MGWVYRCERCEADRFMRVGGGGGGVFFEEELRVVPGEEEGECHNDDMESSMFECMYV